MNSIPLLKKSNSFFVVVFLFCFVFFFCLFVLCVCVFFLFFFFVFFFVLFFVVFFYSIIKVTDLTRCYYAIRSLLTNDPGNNILYKTA